MAEIVAGIAHSAPELVSSSLRFGSANRIVGLSGFHHQIDISLTGQDSRFLIECKKWNKRVGVEPVLVLSGRAEDIWGANLAVKPTAILVSSVGFTRGARLVAERCGVQLEQVKSAQEFGMKLGRQARVGALNRIAFSDSVKVVVYRNGQVVDE